VVVRTAPGPHAGSGPTAARAARAAAQRPIWRFSLYYVVVFGAYVGLAAWLPKYYVDVFGVPLYEAALLTALFIFPASLLRPFGATCPTASALVGSCTAPSPRC
jgi:NNP family nitrate/nitrite transporter-like MFS transporter